MQIFVLITFIFILCTFSKERGRAVTSVFGSLELGSVVGLVLCGFLIKNFGWQSVFYMFGIAGLAWTAIWPLFRPDDPSLQIDKVSLNLKCAYLFLK